MKRSTLKLIIIESVLLIALLLNTFVINAYREYSLIFIIGIALFIAIYILGYEKNAHRYKKDIILNTLIYTLSLQILLYLAGIFLGFIKNGYNLAVINIIRNVLPVIITIVLSELLRYEINTKGEKNKIVIVFSMLIFVMIDLSLQIHLYDLHIKREIFEMMAIIILPSIAKNILMTYYSLNFGCYPNIIYRFIMELPIYFVPIIPNLGLYLQSVLSLLFPILIFYRTNENLEDVFTRPPKKSITSKIITCILIIIMIIMMCLISGIFKYYILAVGSNSMSPHIKRGDSVIIEKINQDELKKLNKNDILVYRHNNIVVIHRIVDIRHINHKYYFKTKGDANNDEDDWMTNEIDVIGKVQYRLPLMGYPTVWFNEALDGGKNE